MNITLEERKAISKVMLDIIVADGEVDAGEIEFLETIQQELGITTAEIDASQDMDHRECLNLLSGLNDDDKKFVGEMMHGMMTADGETDEVELIALKSICEETGIPLPN